MLKKWALQDSDEQSCGQPRFFTWITGKSQYPSSVSIVRANKYGVTTGEGANLPPPCGKCNVIFRYIYMSTTKLVLHLSYLVRLH